MVVRVTFHDHRWTFSRRGSVFGQRMNIWPNNNLREKGKKESHVCGLSPQLVLNHYTDVYASVHWLSRLPLHMLWSRQPDRAVCKTVFYQSIHFQNLLRISQLVWLIHAFMGLEISQMFCRPTGLMQGAVIGRLRLFAWGKQCLNKNPGNIWGSLAFSDRNQINV